MMYCVENLPIDKSSIVETWVTVSTRDGQHPAQMVCVQGQHPAQMVRVQGQHPAQMDCVQGQHPAQMVCVQGQDLAQMDSGDDSLYVTLVMLLMEHRI
ncbi:hypothetical protein MAR_015989 [Mya arenaria]|uniref:Uncharacterized protein n=1 Tax=Mya arenaria TaxID=6604 RepID=A0ABY7FIK4_MYAAR|nr:hypothetical protein MAR_015989 [Mya arenaria]